jgi:3-methyladenine DNA glycosylase AlkD
LTSEATARATSFVASRLPDAHALGARLADLIDEPTRFVGELTDGLRSLADPIYADARAWVAPGSDVPIGVRRPLLRAVEAELRTPIRQTSSSIVLPLAQRLGADRWYEVRLFALPCLRRALPDEPERSWQLLRRLAFGAKAWDETDALVDVYAQGVLAERFRWAELEQLVYSPKRMERRLVGATVACMAHALPRARRSVLATLPALTLIESLLGDADDQVQKSLSWALREWNTVDPPGVSTLLQVEAATARRSDDGHRAWVIRDALSVLPAAEARRIREQLEGVRRRPGSPSTSRAATLAAGFNIGALADQAVALQGDRYARAAGGEAAPAEGDA